VFRSNDLKYFLGNTGNDICNCGKMQQTADKEAGLKGGNLILNTDHGIKSVEANACTKTWTR
jgi:hypothetical protein